MTHDPLPAHWTIKEGFLFCTKPAGISVHRVNEDHLGFAERLERRYGFPKLWVCHRLDKNTTGVLCFAFSKEKAQILSEAFAQRSVKKTYIFITDHAPLFVETMIQSQIKKVGEGFVSLPTSTEANAFTHFRVLQTQGKFSVIEAKPVTGKPHQIRLHARDAKIPIVGDVLYGGTPFAFPLLHAHQIEIPSLFGDNHFLFSSPLPPHYENPALLDNLRLARWSYITFQRKLLGLEALPTLRWIHREDPQVCVDQLGSYLGVQWYEQEDPDSNLLKDVQSLTEHLGLRGWFVRKMLNRGSDAKQKLLWKSDGISEQWISQENQTEYEFRLNTGTSPGLFLDQRQNRKWVTQNSSEKKVLNLFCYTGGFSLAAAKGNAKEVTSVDTSGPALEWAQQNFKLNQVQINQPDIRLEFHKADAFIFLKGCLKRQRFFDLIICDPPSLSRSKERTFKIAQDLKELLSLMTQCLSPDGKILFTTNFEGWENSQHLQRDAKEILKHLNLETLVPAEPDFDFEIDLRRSVLKTLLLKKKSPTTDKRFENA